MQIVIDIPDNMRQMCRWHRDFVCTLTRSETDILAKAIINGIVLPKNHGRLIDAEQLMNYCQNQIDGHKYADCNVIARFPIVLGAGR